MVSLPTLRVVLDTNVLLVGMTSEFSTAANILRAAADRRFITLLSRAVLSEYRSVLHHPAIQNRFRELTSERVEIVLAGLRFIGEMKRSKDRFEFPRDARDAKFLELAIGGKATHLVSRDNDLLSLVDSHSDPARRLRQRVPGLRIMPPNQFTREYAILMDLR